MSNLDDDFPKFTTVSEGSYAALLFHVADAYAAPPSIIAWSERALTALSRPPLCSSG